MINDATAQGKTVVLAFSGGLDTSFCLTYLREQGWRVITVTVDTGGMRLEQQTETSRRAEELGSDEHILIDGKQRLYDEFVSYIIKGDYLRNHVYPSCTGAERTVVAEAVTRIALGHGADAIAHGSTGAGNDHVRFDTVILSMAPAMQILAPVRDHGFTRETETEYLIERGIDVPSLTSTYSINEGMLGTTIGGKETHDSWEYLPDEAWVTTVAIDEAPEVPQDLVLHYEYGLPAAVMLGATGELDQNATFGGLAVLATLNQLGALHGVGRGIHIGTTIMGIPGRLGFEAPGLEILIAAHQELERLTLTARQQSLVTSLGTMYGDMLHEAMFGDPVMRDIESFLDSVSRRVKGDVRVRLHKGSVVITGARSPYSLMASSSRLGSTYGHGTSRWTGDEARAFAKLHATSSVIAAAADTGPTHSPVEQPAEPAVALSGV